MESLDSATDFAPRSVSGRLWLPPGEVQVWACRLDPGESVESSLGALLDPYEHARAERFRFAEHRRRFRVGRGFLRLLLGAYLAERGSDVRLGVAPRGKPFLRPPLDASGLCFNLSHSGELALVAVAHGGRLGVDVEILRPLVSAEAIAHRFFSADEEAELAAVPSEDRAVAFLHGWTRKEAYLKALGDGLAVPLRSFAVTLTPGAPARLLKAHREDGARAPWSIFSLRPASGYVGALVVEGRAWRLRTWTATEASP
jgi:4'-phosphopantetheinyl transferase